MIEDGYYNDDITAKTIDKCPDKCKTCSYASVITNHNLCLSCNTDDGYYPIIDDPSNIIIYALLFMFENFMNIF